MRPAGHRQSGSSVELSLRSFRGRQGWECGLRIPFRGRHALPTPGGKLWQNICQCQRDGGAAVKAYDDDDGTEQAYYGRGYVQPTWWSNYAASGVAIGRGPDLLLDPELVRSAEIAYDLMSHGMRTGQGFANGHRLAQYFSGTLTDYVGARRMVNGQDHAADIAAIATRFEAILLKASHPDESAATPP